MAIDFKGLCKRPHIFRQLSGLTVIEFQEVVKKLSPGWEKIRPSANWLKKIRIELS